MIKKILIGLLIVLVLVQFIRPARNNGAAATTNDVTHVVPVPDTVLRILQVSCYDCHSNHTSYPWYANINPIGNWLAHHVEEGKAELNFSECATYSKKKMNHKLDEIMEQVTEKEMPLSSYTILHGDAKLNSAQIAMIVDWVSMAKTKLGYQEGQ